MDQGCTVIHLHLLLYILMRINSYWKAYIPKICHYNNCYSHLKVTPNHDTHQTLFIYYLYIKCIIMTHMY